MTEKYAGDVTAAAGNALLLGPIVGHTDATSSRIWIQVEGALSDWRVDVDGREPVTFVSTESRTPEFGTAIATIEGLEADTLYTYTVRHGIGAPASTGSFRTMPADDSILPITFVTLSCNDDREPNAWQLLQEFIEAEKPRFLLMIGDQVYLDESDDANVWQLTFDSPRATRRQAMVQKYEKLWAVEPLATILRNIPSYMTWDDHDIRDGWGSFAGDSPTLAAASDEAAAIVAKYRAYFEDAYDVYYHFQTCRNPRGDVGIESKATPFSFRCGRLQVIVPDGRTDRDFARPANAILGDAQWRWLEVEAAAIAPDIDAIAVATSVPIVDLDPDGQVHRFFRERTDDVDLLRKGDEEGLFKLLAKSDSPLAALPSLIAAATFDREYRVAKALGFRVGDLDDVRDKWSYGPNNAEQERLLRLFSKATNRKDQPRRALSFYGGDIHVGAIFTVEMQDEGTSFECVVSSGIAKSAPIPEVHGVLVDSSFDVAPGIHAELQSVVNAVNFGTTTASFGYGAAPAMVSRIVKGDDPSLQDQIPPA